MDKESSNSVSLAPNDSRNMLTNDTSSRVEKDQTGTTHLLMHFNVEGPINKGVVNLHMVKPPGQKDFEYKYLALDVEGQRRLWLINADGKSNQKKGVKIFGVQWR